MTDRKKEGGGGIISSRANQCWRKRRQALFSYNKFETITTAPVRYSLLENRICVRSEDEDTDKLHESSINATQATHQEHTTNQSNPLKQ